MSAETQPITPARFAEALQDLPTSALALKVLELRNSIAHLDYSNAELKPFADGTASAIESPGQQQQATTTGTPDQDCIDAIKENEAVIERMQQRIELVRAEVERRGHSWSEFQGKEDDDAPVPASASAETGNPAASGDDSATPTTNQTNGVNGHAETSGESATTNQQHEAWRDGTFQTGTIRGMSDEEVLRQLMSRMPGEENGDDDSEGGMHL